MAIELTPEQRQALLAHPDGPVDVVDPITRRNYVLVAREQYATGGASTPAAPPPAEQAPVPVPVRLATLPTPPEVAAEARRFCAKWRPWGGRKSLAEVEEDLKLQFYFGGKCINYVRGAEGLVVLAAGRAGTSDYQQQLDAIPAHLRPNLIFAIPCRFDDDVAEILSPHCYED